MKKLMKPRIAFFAMAALIPLSGCANHSATFKVRVVNEEGQPINGVHADIYNVFDMDSKPGLTDINGFYSSHLNNIVEVSGRFEKHGYYKTSGVFWKVSEKEIVPPADTNFTFILRRIIDPVPMIKKEVSVNIPRVGEPIGFDLEVGDWVSPDGKGKIADILFTQEGYYTSEKDYSFNLLAEFTAEENGIQSFQVPRVLRSELLSPQVAPELGYERTFESFRNRKPPMKSGASPYEATRRWIYRIRTVLNEEGKIVSANYGWLTDDIIFGVNADGTFRIELKYYLNPNLKSRSLEPKEIADRQAKGIPQENPQ